jgi:hypothetical protein
MIEWSRDTNLPLGQLKAGNFHTPVVEPIIGAIIGYLIRPGWLGPIAGLVIGDVAALGYDYAKSVQPVVAPGTAATKGCSCSRPKPAVARASVGRSPYSLHHANASRFKAAAELALLEDHMINDPCPDCMNKHAMTASRLMSEAATLDEGEAGDVVGAELIEDIRQALKPESDIPLANRSRDIRKKIQQKLQLSHVNHAHDD